MVGAHRVLRTPEQGSSGLDEQAGPELSLAERRGSGSLQGRRVPRGCE